MCSLVFLFGVGRLELTASSRLSSDFPAQLSVPASTTVTRYAYETEASKPISAGSISGVVAETDADAVPMLVLWDTIVLRTVSTDQVRRCDLTVSNARHQ